MTPAVGDVAIVDRDAVFGGAVLAWPFPDDRVLAEAACGEIVCDREVFDRVVLECAAVGLSPASSGIALAALSDAPEPPWPAGAPALAADSTLAAVVSVVAAVVMALVAAFTACRAVDTGTAGAAAWVAIEVILAAAAVTLTAAAEALRTAAAGVVAASMVLVVADSTPEPGRAPVAARPGVPLPGSPARAAAAESR